MCDRRRAPISGLSPPPAGSSGVTKPERPGALALVRSGRQHAGMLPLNACLPNSAPVPSGSGCLHEIKHDGYRGGT